jgi:putative sterol carrier protein
VSGDGEVQIRLSAGRHDVRVEGPDDARVVVTVNLADAALDPTVAFMTGKLKSSGATGPLLAALSDGTIAAAINRLASQP